MDLKEIPNRDEVVDKADRIVTRPWNKWLTDIRAAVNTLIGGTFAGGIFERGRTVAMGDWIHVPFDAGNFTANGTMTWTVEVADQVTLAYTLVGTTMILAWHIIQSSVGGTLNNQLRIAIPDGFTSAVTLSAPNIHSNAGALPTGFATVTPGAAFVQIFKADQTNYVASTNTTSTRGQIAFEVQ